jgi:quinoprotein glucose dehydrogenase
MSVDQGRGIVYLPIGSPAYDFYGGDRKGKNLFGNSIVALNAATGKLKWYFQLVHHDLWDYDLPAQPSLITLRREGRSVPAVAVVTKMGFVFVFNRVTGKPLFPIENGLSPRAGFLVKRLQGKNAGKQFVVVASGGGGFLRSLSSVLSDAVVAYALP